MSKRVFLQKLGNEESSYAESEQIKVGGPFLDDSLRDPSTCSRRPIITPPLRSRKKASSTSLEEGDSRTNKNTLSSQYLLIPEKDRIQVLSMEHGGAILNLIPPLDTTNTDHKVIQILSVEVVKESNQDEWIVLAGCSNGLLIEWSLNSIQEMSTQNRMHSLLKLSSQPPRRMFQIAVRRTTDSPTKHINDEDVDEDEVLKIQGDITHISSPPFEPLFVYALIRPYTKNTTENAAHFVRISLPPPSSLMINKKTSETDDPLFTLSSITIYPTFISSFVKETKRNNNKSKIASPSDSTVKKDTDLLTQTQQNPSIQGSSSTLTYSFSNYVKNIILLPHLPILLLSSVNSTNRHPFAVVVHPRGFIYFFDQRDIHIVDEGRLVHFKRPDKSTSRINAACISPDSEDLALAYTDGKIDVYTSISNRTARFVESKIVNPTDFIGSIEAEEKSEKHPGAETLIRTYHWHSLPIHSLSYLGTGSNAGVSSLLSGGEESVLVTWNLERGITKPSHTLPRISKGSICHIVTNKYSMSMEIIVCCMDNTLQLIYSHNYATKWKIHGLATSLNEPTAVIVPKDSDPLMSISTPILALDPRTKYPILSRLAGAPGVVHWFDIVTGRVVGELEIAPYNRVSRKEVSHLAYPRPVITHLVISASGDDIVTVDTMLTENPNVGALRTISHGGTQFEMSITTNIKFWAWSKSLAETSGRGLSMPYDMISAMHAPHGLMGQVHALALSPLGNKACTFNAYDGSFHLWSKDRTQLLGDKKQASTSSTTPPTPPWKRLYKISAPAGYANSQLSHNVNASNVAFAADGSLLAVAYGKNITLWDHSSATMLHSIVAQDTLSCLSFIKSPADMLLATGTSFISTLPIFGMLYLGGGIWTYATSENEYSTKSVKTELGPTIALSSNRDIAIVLLEKCNSKSSAKALLSSKVLIIDSHTGEPRMIDKVHPLVWSVQGSVTCLCDISSRGSSRLSLLAITGVGEMKILCAEIPDTNDVDGDEANTRQLPYFDGMRNVSMNNLAPSLPESKKQRLNATPTNMKHESSGVSSFLSSFPTSTSELPILSHLQFINAVTKVMSK